MILILGTVSDNKFDVFMCFCVLVYCLYYRLQQDVVKLSCPFFGKLNRFVKRFES